MSRDFRYRPGWRMEYEGTRLWTQQGRKSPGDIRLMVHAPQATPLRMLPVAFALDVLFEAEDIARERPQYARLKTYQGWKKMAALVKDVYDLGPERAVARWNTLAAPLFLGEDFS